MKRFMWFLSWAGVGFITFVVMTFMSGVVVALTNNESLEKWVWYGVGLIVGVFLGYTNKQAEQKDN
jgi:bacteriorhodopsin